MKNKKIRSGLILAVFLAQAVLTPIRGAAEFNVLGTAGTSVAYEFLPSSLFEDPDEFGEDLYEYVYNRVKYEPTQVALKQTTSRRPVTQQEIKFIKEGGLIADFAEKGKTPSQVEQAREKFMAEFDLDMLLAEFAVPLKMTAEQTEIFANGDESDSGFDLLVDLAIIEKILFGKSEAAFGTAGPGAPAGSNVIDVPIPGVKNKTPANAAAKTPSNVSVTPVIPAQAGIYRSPVDAGDDNTSRPGGLPPQPVPGLSTLEPVVCAINPSFNNEVTRALNRELLSAPGSGQSVGPSGGGADPSGRAPQGGPRPPPPSGTGAGSSAAGGVTPESLPIAPEPPVSWMRPRLCDDIFCLTVEAVMKKESSYLASESCIACHFEKINDAFKKTISHNLVPSKPAGNMFESAKCKAGISSNPFWLKWNVVLVPQPIVTPPNDDLVTGGDFVRNFVDSVEKYYGAEGNCAGLRRRADKLQQKYAEVLAVGNEDPEELQEDLQDVIDDIDDADEDAGPLCEPQPSPEQVFAAGIFNAAPKGLDQSQAMSAVKSEMDRKKQEALTILHGTQYQASAEAQAGQFSVLLTEMKTMNGYFKGFRNLFIQITSETNPDAPCSMLISKPQCSNL